VSNASLRSTNLTESCDSQDDEANDPIAKQPQRVCRATLPWLIFFSLGVWQAQPRAGVYAEASAIVYTLGQSRGVTAIAKIAGGLVLLRM
jgi:hypothetical protein